MFTLGQWLLGFLMPAVISAGMILFVGRRRRRRAWVIPLAVGAAFVAGYVGAVAWPTFRPADSMDWIWLIAVAATMLGVAQATERLPTWLSAMLVLLLAAAGMWLLARPLTRHTWNLRGSLLWIGGLAGAAAMLCGIIASFEKRVRGPTFPLALFLIATAAGACLLLSASLKLAQLSWILTAATLGLTLVAAWRRRDNEPCRGVAVVFVLVLASLVAYGHLFGSLAPATALLLLASPVAMFAGDTPKIPPSWRAVVRVIGVIVPLAMALGVAYVPYAERSAAPGYYY